MFAYALANIHIRDRLRDSTDTHESVCSAAAFFCAAIEKNYPF
jgi:hypothetical protein